MSSKKVCAHLGREKILWSKSAVNEQQLDGLWKNSFIRNITVGPISSLIYKFGQERTFRHSYFKIACS